MDSMEYDLPDSKRCNNMHLCISFSEVCRFSTAWYIHVRYSGYAYAMPLIPSKNSQYRALCWYPDTYELFIILIPSREREVRVCFEAILLSFKSVLIGMLECRFVVRAYCVDQTWTWGVVARGKQEILVYLILMSKWQGNGWFSYK